MGELLGNSQKSLWHAPFFGTQIAWGSAPLTASACDGLKTGKDEIRLIAVVNERPFMR